MRRHSSSYVLTSTIRTLRLAKQSEAPIAAFLIPRPLVTREVCLKHFFVNFFGFNASNRINEMDSADKKLTPLSEYGGQKSTPEKKGKTNEEVYLVNSVINHP